MPVYPRLYRFYRRLGAAMKGDRRYSLLVQLRREQFLPETELNVLCEERLSRLLRHAAQNSPFYRERLHDLELNDAGSLELARLTEILPLTREDIQQRGNDILINDRPGLYADASGGSTGRPVNFYHDAYYRTFAAACEILFLEWMGITQGDKMANLWGADRDFHELSFRDRIFDRLKRTRTLNSFRMDDEAIDRFVNEMVAFNPPYMIGYASSLHVVAERMLATGARGWDLKAIRSAAEMLYDYQRESIEKAFGSVLYDFYGSREVSHLAAECEQHHGMHIFASGRIVEVVDEAGQPLPPGETGYLCVTDLTNYAFPFVRYLNGDMAVMNSERCLCGRSWPLITKLVGRASDIIKLNGKLIHGEYFTHLFYGHPEVKQFQVVQKSSEQLVIRVVAAEREFDSDGITGPIRKEVGPGVDICIELVDSIEPTASGKYRFTVNECQ